MPKPPRLPGAPSPIAADPDAETELYFGHLAARAEAVLAESEVATRIAFAWLVARIAHDRARLWRLDLEAPAMDTVSLGDVTLHARIAPVPRDPVPLQRRDYLRAEGRDVLALARPFACPTSAAALENITAFAAISLARSLPARPAPLRVDDMLGNAVTIRIRLGRPLRERLSAALGAPITALARGAGRRRHSGAKAGTRADAALRRDT